MKKAIKAILFVLSYSILNLIFGCQSTEKVQPRLKNACQCVQKQYLVDPPDTILLWTTDTITLDSMSVHYSFLYCGIDTAVWTPDSIVVNEMKCWN